MLRLHCLRQSEAQPSHPFLNILPRMHMVPFRKEHRFLTQPKPNSQMIQQCPSWFSSIEWLRSVPMALPL